MKFLNRIFFSIIALNLLSCGSINSLSNGQKVKMRIVDLQGNVHDVKMRTPELNVQALTNQGRISEEVLNAQVAKSSADQVADSGNKYAGNSVDALKNTMQLPEDPQRAAQARAERPSVTESDIITAGNAPQNQEQEIEYDLNSDAKKKVIAGKKAVKETNLVKEGESKNNSSQKGIFVQTGSFSILQYAKKSMEQIEKDIGKSTIQIAEATHENKTVYRVLIGPFPNKQKASAMIAKLAKSHHQAIIVRNK